jgi:hypothetical protein
MTRGAGVLPRGRYAFSISAGLPHAEAKFIIPVNEYLEVNPILRFGYVAGINLSFLPSLAGGAEFKFNIYQRGGDDLALVFGVLGQVWLVEDAIWDMWMGGLDFRYSHRWNRPCFGLFTGLRVSYFGSWGKSFMELPMDVYVGFEFQVARGVTMHLSGNAGGSPFGGFSFVIAGFQLGVSYAW